MEPGSFAGDHETAEPERYADRQKALRSIAFYLPQYHPIPENDEWWGTGFTEWSNVVRATPRFRDHYQPHLPADLGFYDLRLPEARAAQAALAKQHGVDGFCYYHYWFNGRRLLNRPFDEVLRSGEPDFPFMLCWANENWTRRWDGHDAEVLLAQNYSLEDDRRHIQSLLPAFRDPRYITIDGKPVFLVYRVKAVPNPAATMELWRAEALKAGLPGLYLCSVEAGDTVRPLTQPTDGVPMPPSNSCRTSSGSVPSFDRASSVESCVAFFVRAVGCDTTTSTSTTMSYPGRWLTTRRPTSGSAALCRRGTTAHAVRRGLSSSEGQRRRSTRTGSGKPSKTSRAPSPEENLIFTNAWNEWAEGNHLEPDLRWGHAYLDAHARARPRSLKQASGLTCADLGASDRPRPGDTAPQEMP